MNNKTYYLIPARKGSKGLPGKNRILFENTASILRELDNVIVSSDDEVLLEKAKINNFIAHKRSEKAASDTATSKDFALEVINDLKLSDDSLIVVLMLTYPNRKIIDINEAIKFFTKNKARSLLCKKEVKNTPYLMLFEEENSKGKQVIAHNLCRRQDYKKVFELSHFISIFYAGEIKDLNSNLYNENTVYYKPNTSIYDIDTIKDLESWRKNENKNNC